MKPISFAFILGLSIFVQAKVIEEHWKLLDAEFSGNQYVILKNVSAASIAILSMLDYKVFEAKILNSVVHKSEITAILLKNKKAKVNFQHCFSIVDDNLSLERVRGKKCTPYKSLEIKPKSLPLVSVVTQTAEASQDIDYTIVFIHTDIEKFINEINNEFDKQNLDFSYKIPEIIKRNN